MVMIIKATKKELIVKEGSTIYSVTPETAPPQVQEALKEYQQKNPEKPKQETTKKTTTTKKADNKKEETPKKTTTKKKTNTKKAKKQEE